MTEMHDRVTKALLPAFEHIADKGYREIIAGCWARAAMEAMRDPTHDMLDPKLPIEYTMPSGELQVMTDVPTKNGVWRAMIDAALRPS